MTNTIETEQENQVGVTQRQEEDGPVGQLSVDNNYIEEEDDDNVTVIVLENDDENDEVNDNKDL